MFCIDKHERQKDKNEKQTQECLRELREVPE